jgi:hypothetical protein
LFVCLFVWLVVCLFVCVGYRLGLHAPSFGGLANAIHPLPVGRQLRARSALQNWCHIATDKMRVANLLVDPHAPPRVRVNAAMSNFEPFAKAFCCRNGTTMNNPAGQCPLW